MNCSLLVVFLILQRWAYGFHVVPRLRVSRLDASTMEEQAPVDNRPFDQRVAGPRPARRMNHAFRYLYRHATVNETSFAVVSAFDFLEKVVGYSQQEIHDMNQTFPPLLELDVKRHLFPKLRFARGTLGLESMQEIRRYVPPQFFGARLERIVAPRHAFLVHHDIIHGRDLITNATAWRDFLVACRKPKQFVALCNTRKREQSGDNIALPPMIDIHQVQAFDTLFQRGLMAATRNELNYTSAPQSSLNITSAEMTSLLIQHGANPLETDARGSSLMHWAAGTGNLETLQVLLPYLGIMVETQRDGATPLHWAAAGANKREFGIGGYEDVCRYLLEQADDDTRLYANKLTKDGNSALMWSAWAGSLDVVKLLVRNRADALVSNRNGCTVAHWAASGGNLECCQYLYETVGVDFTNPNHGGNTPLTHAVAFGRAHVVKWLREDVVGDDGDDTVAASLAKEFVDWTGGADEKRQEVLSLFEDWYGGGSEQVVDSVEEECY